MRKIIPRIDTKTTSIDCFCSVYDWLLFPVVQISASSIGYESNTIPYSSQISNAE